MKKMIAILLALGMLLALAACGAAPETPAQEEAPPSAETEAKEWSLQGYFSDEDGNMVSVTWMDDIVDPGWYVGAMIGDFNGGCTLAQEGDTLHGDLTAWDDSADPYVVTLSEDGEGGVLFAVENGESYHLAPARMEEASIFVTLNTEGWGSIAWVEGEEAPEIDPEYPYQSAYINLGEPATYSFSASPQPGSVFMKWTKNGEDFSTDAQITVLLDESADFVAVFEEDPGWQNPVMNFIGDYQCDRASAHVECFGFDEAWITIQWGSSAWELAQWDIVGRLDPDTLTISYSGCTKSIVVYDNNGEVKSQEPEYEDGSGTIVFREDGSFVWHEDQSESGADLVFEWLPVGEG